MRNLTPDAKRKAMTRRNSVRTSTHKALKLFLKLKNKPKAKQQRPTTTNIQSPLKSNRSRMLSLYMHEEERRLFEKQVASNPNFRHRKTRSADMEVK